MYPRDVPKLWNGTIDAHRREVRAAVITAATTLVAEHGLRGVTMSRIAAEAGIGRATLYKYFPDVETILSEWHQDQIAEHLTHLVAITSRAGTARDRLAKVLEAREFPLDRLALSPQCGFASDFRGNPISEDDQWRKLELVATVAESAWGGVGAVA